MPRKMSPKTAAKTVRCIVSQSMAPEPEASGTCRTPSVDHIFVVSFQKAHSYPATALFSSVKVMGFCKLVTETKAPFTPKLKATGAPARACTPILPSMTAWAAGSVSQSAPPTLNSVTTITASSTPNSSSTSIGIFTDTPLARGPISIWPSVAADRNTCAALMTPAVVVMVTTSIEPFNIEARARTSYSASLTLFANMFLVVVVRVVVTPVTPTGACVVV
mmetsp:Transcript_51461/g.166889  ORF Transcript_51461/g.166889 Transcript_51461/m.166889 type:complete len:220 (+) Transcript_51461:2021-2680(+)